MSDSRSEGLHPGWWTLISVVVTVGTIALTATLITEVRSLGKLGLLLLGSGASLAVCHTWLAATRNDNTRLFYRASAIGGVVGTALAILVIPRVTQSPIEFPILTLGTLAVAGFLLSSRILRPFVATLAVIAIGLTIATTPSKGMNLAKQRSFYGCLRVTKWPDREHYSLFNNTTLHGEQDRQDPEKGLSYYRKGTGVEMIIHRAQAAAPALKLGVVGLGTGAINCRLRPEDCITYYEIDPQVEKLAREYFTYLQMAHSRVVIGDGRKCLESEPDQQFDILILDAFTGDGIPTHLLTVEAARTYQRHLKKDTGTLAIHITNAHVDLQPVVEAVARSMGMTVQWCRLEKVVWAVLTPGVYQPGGKVIEWTDQRSSILGVLR